MKEERNALQKDVFPRLRELCMQHGCRFQAIDLRWGVSEEAGLDQQTMRICLEEIARCQRVSPRPNFIVLLGDRYGWRPLPYEIPAGEFGDILGRVQGDDKALLERWYWRDDNAVPPVYCLQPRAGEYADRSKWKVVETQLRNILTRVTAGMSLSGEQRVKFVASATEQEIINGALKTSDAPGHVYCFLRKISGLPADESAKDFVDLDLAGGPDLEARGLMEDLKGRLRSTLPGNCYEYEMAWDPGMARPDHIAKLAEDVYANLEKVILDEIGKIESIDPLEKEIADQAAFGIERSRFFVGRDDIIQKIGSHIRSAKGRPLVIYGDSGSGKSALMAKAASDIKKLIPQAHILIRYIGVTPGSSSGRSLLESMCREINRNYGVSDVETPSTYQELAAEFPRRLENARAEAPLIILIDALDQLANTDEAQDLSWLPVELPPNVHIVVTTLRDRNLAVLEGKLPKDCFIKVDVLKKSDGEAILDCLLGSAGRALQPRQKEELLGKFAVTGLPLYLKLGFEEARLWKSYTEKTVLSPDIPGVIGDLLVRLSAGSNHGSVLVSRSLGLLAAAKNGLTEDEILDVLSADLDVMEDFAKRSYHAAQGGNLPVVVWSRLLMDIEPYLAERSADGTMLFSFHHRQLREVAERKFLDGGDRTARHRALAAYFAAQPLTVGDKDAPNLRKVSELPYQQTYGELWEDLDKLLTDLLFIEAKFRAGLGYDLLEDYNRIGARPREGPSVRTPLFRDGIFGVFCPFCLATTRIKSDDPGKTIECPECKKKIKLNDFAVDRIWAETPKKRIVVEPQCVWRTLPGRLVEFAGFIRSEFHVLIRYPELTVQQAINQPDDSDVCYTARALAKQGVRSQMVKWLNKPMQKSPCVNVLSSRIEWECIARCEYSPDGKRIVSASKLDNVIRLWDTDTGKELRAMNETHGQINACCFSPDGRTILSAAESAVEEEGGKLRLWDTDTGKELKSIAYRHNLLYCVFSPDGKKIASTAADKTIQIWDADTGQQLASLEGHADSALRCDFSPDCKSLVSASNDGTLKIWNIESGKDIKTLRGHSGGVVACCYSPDGKSILSASSDLTIRIWDAGTGRETRLIKDYYTRLEDCCFSPDGRKIAAATDKIIRIWNAETGVELKAMRGNLANVKACRFSPDGLKVVSASDEDVLRIWDLESRTVSKDISRGSNDFSPDGKKVISSTNFEVLIRDAESGRELNMIKDHRGISLISSYCFSPDGKKVLIAFTDRLSLRDAGTGDELLMLHRDIANVKSCSFSSDGSMILISTADNRIRILDVATGGKIIDYKAHDSPVTDLQLSPDGKSILSASADDSVSIRDLETGTELRLRDDTRPQSREIKDANDANSRLNDLKNLAKLWVVSGCYMTPCCYSPDGGKVASGSRHKLLYILDSRTGKELRVLDCHSIIHACAFLPDNRRIITSSFDGLLRVWDVDTGEVLDVIVIEKLIFSLKVSNRACGILASDNVGNMYRFSISMPESETLIVTPVRLYLMDDRRWDTNLTAICKWCGERFTVEQKSVDTIACPHCGKKLRLTPFIVDNSGKTVRPQAGTADRPVMAKPPEANAPKPAAENKKPRWKLW